MTYGDFKASSDEFHPKTLVSFPHVLYTDWERRKSDNCFYSALATYFRAESSADTRMNTGEIGQSSNFLG